MTITEAELKEAEALCKAPDGELYQSARIGLDLSPGCSACSKALRFIPRACAELRETQARLAALVDLASPNVITDELRKRAEKAERERDEALATIKILEEELREERTAHGQFGVGA
jgi:hypothetical protein